MSCFTASQVEASKYNEEGDSTQEKFTKNSKNVDLIINSLSN